MKKLLLSAILILLVTSCSMPKLRFDQTCITCIKSQRFSCKGDECPQTFMIGSDAVVTIIETGENIYMTDILTQEGIALKSGLPLTLAKLNGRIYITGDNFSTLWSLYPNPENSAGYKMIQLPEAVKLESPVFEIFNNHLVLTAKNLSTRYLYNEEDDKWELQNPTKGAK